MRKLLTEPRALQLAVGLLALPGSDSPALGLQICRVLPSLSLGARISTGGPSPPNYPVLSQHFEVSVDPIVCPLLSTEAAIKICCEALWFLLL